MRNEIISQTCDRCGDEIEGCDNGKHSVYVRLGREPSDPAGERVGRITQPVDLCHRCAVKALRALVTAHVTTEAQGREFRAAFGPLLPRQTTVGA